MRWLRFLFRWGMPPLVHLPDIKGASARRVQPGVYQATRVEPVSYRARKVKPEYDAQEIQ